MLRPVSTMNNSPPICSAKEPNRSSCPGRICSTASARRAPRSKLPVEIHHDDSATVAYNRSTPSAAGLERAEGALCQGPRPASPAAFHGGFTARRTFHPGGHGSLFRLLEESNHQRDDKTAP